MAANDHATFNASSASRWISCPGSINLIGSLPPVEGERISHYADEGTAAHNLAQLCLENGTDAKDSLGCSILGQVERWPVTEEMVEAVQCYLDEVRSHIERLGGKSVHLDIERAVSPIPGRGDMWGTADALVYEPFGELIVFDLKYGRGVVVEVEWNDQAMFYGLGALRAIGADDVSTVTIVVVQPRAEHPDGKVRRWTVEKDVLLAYADGLAAAADFTKNPDAPRRPGKHCRFCPAGAVCPELRNLSLLVAVNQFEDLPEEIEEPAAHVRLPNPLDPEELAKAMQIIPLLDFWSREVQALVQRELERGHAVPGWKLVRKRANRAWIDAEAVERKLRNRTGIHVDQIYKKVLHTPAQIEKVMGKEWVAKHAHKPEGTLSIAPTKDPRPAEIPPCVAEFPDLDDDLGDLY